MNVFDFAMQMEVDGKAYYLQLARESEQPGLKTIFMRLAEDEQKHYEIFRVLKGGGPTPTMQDSLSLKGARTIFEDLLAQPEKGTPIKGDIAAYRHAMKLEAASYRFYEEAAAKEQRGVVKQLLLRVAEEEHQHFTVLENVYQFVNAPNQYLAWGEFSNLEEFHQFGRDDDV